MFLLVGLGNPGQKYARTRHNVGFDVVDRLGERWGIAVTRSSSQSLVGDGLVKNERAVLMKPQAYVNRSGGPVRAAMDFYKLLNRKAGRFTLLAVYDPATAKRWEETVKPVDSAEEAELLYKRWVRRRRADVDKLSGGKIGYVTGGHALKCPVSRS